MYKNINEEMVKKLYEKFLNYLQNEEKALENYKETEIITKIKELIGKDEYNKWNENSFRMYIRTLLLMLKGKKLNFTPKKEDLELFKENLCKDFPNKCQNVKNSISLTEKKKDKKK